ncbi:hypothetical protein F5X99DRAFT_411453 [Biscogniauxia marginata]|nr:hypothetical protein F5X99DRAFT_411453 [Biscogniauxia marginata]
MALAFQNVDEAEKIKKANGPVWDFETSRGKPTQLGYGVYTVPAPGEWSNRRGDWHCLFKINSKALKDVPKIWIPQWYGKEQTFLWTIPDEVERYVGTVNDDWDVDTSFLMSRIWKMEDKLQLLIPPDLVDDDDMGWEAECQDSINKLSIRTQVNYDAWTNNVGGTKDPVVEDSSDSDEEDSSGDSDMED